jgi:hypothetical protein
MDSVIFFSVISNILQRISKNEGERIMFLWAIVYSSDVETRAVVSHGRTASTTEKVQQPRIHRTPNIRHNVAQKSSHRVRLRLNA